MTTTDWIFVDFDGVLRRFPVARWLRIRQAEEPWPGRAGQDIHAVEIRLGVERRRVQRVWTIVPYRVPVNVDGFVDREACLRIALGRRFRLGYEEVWQSDHWLDDKRGVPFGYDEFWHSELGLDDNPEGELGVRADPIRRLQLQASHFWALRASHIADLARALGRNADEVRAAVWRPELLAEARA